MGSLQKVKDTLRDASASGNESLKQVAKTALDFFRDHAPTSEQLDFLKSQGFEFAKRTGSGMKALVSELVESKPFRDAAKGGLVGATIAVPVPGIGPLFGGLLGGAVALYFSHKSDDTAAATVQVPAEGSPLYAWLLQLDDLRKRGILTREQFEAQVKAALDANLGSSAGIGKGGALPLRAPTTRAA